MARSNSDRCRVGKFRSNSKAKKYEFTKSNIPVKYSNDRKSEDSSIKSKFIYLRNLILIGMSLNKKRTRDKKQKYLAQIEQESSNYLPTPTIYSKVYSHANLTI